MVLHRWIRIGVIAPLLVVTLTGCLKQKTDTTTTDTPTDTVPTPPPANDLTTQIPSTFDTALNAHLTQATEASKAWKPDAVISYVSVELPSLEPNAGNEVYVFGSASDLDNWWTYSLAQPTGKFVRAIIPKTDFLGADIDPINTSYWTMNYVEALQLAEQNGGATFRTTNPGSRVTTFLSHRAPRNFLWWTVEYTAPTGQVLTLLINPFRGEVVDETGTELAPATRNSGGVTTPTSTTPSNTSF